MSGKADELINRQDAIRLAEQGQIQGFEWQFKKLCDLPSAEPEKRWTTKEVAELLFNLFGDECACNYFGIDEWLPERCKYTEIAGQCPEPNEKHGCWMQFLLQGGADMKGDSDG